MQYANSLPAEERSGYLDEAKVLDPKLVFAQSISEQFNISFPSGAQGAVLYPDNYPDARNLYYIFAGVHGTGSTTQTGVGILVWTEVGNPGVVLEITATEDETTGVITLVKIWYTP